MGFVPHAAIVAPRGERRLRAVVLHGIFGSGGNFRTLCRALADAAPGLECALVDLRAHGSSTSPPPPFTVNEAAADLERLEAAQGAPFEVAVGHSFGGKVALRYAERRALAGRPLTRLWVLDSNPGVRPAAGADARSGLGRDEASAVLGMLSAMPWPLPSRERFVELVLQAGHSRPIADWLAMNVRRADDGFVLRTDLTVIAALLDDYFALDLWPALETRDVAGGVRFVVGGASPALSEADRARLASIEARSTRLQVLTLPGAGHWVHVDAGEALLGALAADLAPLASPPSP